MADHLEKHSPLPCSDETALYKLFHSHSHIQGSNHIAYHILLLFCSSLAFSGQLSTNFSCSATLNYCAHDGKGSEHGRSGSGVIVYSQCFILPIPEPARVLRKWSLARALELPGFPDLDRVVIVNSSHPMPSLYRIPLCSEMTARGRRPLTRMFEQWRGRLYAFGNLAARALSH